jgi:hypothetical protein
MIRNCVAVGLAAAVLVFAPSIARAQDVPSDYQEVLSILGKKGDYKANVLKVNIPRSDLKVSVDGVALPTSFGFGGWLAMTHGDRGDVMMGDLVLLEDEVNPVMTALLQNGLEVTAIHNHFFWESPRIFYMHVHGMGKPADLARKAKPAVDLIGQGSTLRAAAVTQLEQKIAAGEMDTAALDKVVGHTGEKLAGGVYKFTVGRDDLKMKEMGAPINARMGLNTWAAFVGSDSSAVVAGDVAMVESEVQPVLRTLRLNNINVVAMHHHMIGSRPMVIFLHYWGKGPAATLARAFRETLDQLGKKGEATAHR